MYRRKGGRKHPHQEFIQVNTTDILFICGGAFVGLDKIIERRIGRRVIGFGQTDEGPVVVDEDNILIKVEPEDLIKFGLIPEFVGRFACIFLTHELDLDALKQFSRNEKRCLQTISKTL